MKSAESTISLPVLVVGAEARTLALLAEVFGKDLKSVPSWMEAIGEAAGGRYQLILGNLDRASEDSILAVSALRSANSKARIVLYCKPIQEPLARRALAVGADDYLIEPLTRQELLPTLNGQLSGSAVVEPDVSPSPQVSLETDHPPAETVAALTDSYSLCAQLLQAGKSGIENLLAQAQRILAEYFAVQWVQMQVLDESAVAQPLGDAHLEHSVQLARGGRLLIRLGPPLPQRTAQPHPQQMLAQIAHMLGSLVDVSREITALQTLAVTDELTGLYNRRYVYEFTEQVLSRAHGERFEVTVLLFDVDNFKHYNDTYGHATGDEVLRETSELMRRCSREHDLVGRFGGDEFVMVFWDAEQRRQPDSRHPQKAFSLSERFRREVSSHDYKCLGPKAKGTLTISGGLASFPWDASTADGLFARADDALLQAKASGKNRIYIVGHERAR
ncbi:MAG: diguanylate cyclase [Actinobacteria bacterium]|nr:diguanylate cyclase [Actinomycetota bacterium]